MGSLNATNPCGEQPLHPYDTCNLGSVVLPRMVRSRDGVTFEVDWEKFRETIHRAVRFWITRLISTDTLLKKSRNIACESSNRLGGHGVRRSLDSFGRSV